MAAQLQNAGWLLIENAVSSSECTSLIGAIRQYERRGGMERIDRKDITSTFWTFNGPEVGKHVVGSKALLANVNELINRLKRADQALFQSSGMNVNAMRPEDQLGFHYDAQELSAVLHLNSVEGGEVELQPRRRVRENRSRGVQSLLLRARHAVHRRNPLRRHLTKPQVVAPRGGSLLIMEASVSLHRVLPVRGADTRYSIVMAYDRSAVAAAKATYSGAHGTRPSRQP
jgi:hypothetical protein